MADTDSLDRPDLDYWRLLQAHSARSHDVEMQRAMLQEAVQCIGKLDAALCQREVRARSMESQLADRPSVDAILDFEWREGRPHTAHRQHQFYYDCAVCQGDVKAMLTLTRPE